MPNFTHKPLPVFATQYTGDNAEEIKAAFPGTLIFEEPEPGISILIRPGCYRDIYKEDNTGDYIIRDHNGNISVLGEKEFKERYGK